MITILIGRIIAKIFCEVLAIILLEKITKKTKRIAILGMKGSGKTTMWNQLQNKIQAAPPAATSEEKIESFTIKSDNKKVYVPETKDIGGGDDWVCYYSEIINSDGTYIYFLVDLTNLHEKDRALGIRARLLKISSIIKEKRLKNCGCKILATNKKKYIMSGLEQQYGNPQEYVKKSLKLHTLEKMQIDIDSAILPVELTDEDDIMKLKNEITA